MLEGTGLAWVKLDTDPPTISKYMCPYCNHIFEKQTERCPNCGRNMYEGRRCGNCAYHLNESLGCLNKNVKWARIGGNAAGCEYWEHGDVHYDVPVGKAPPIGIMPEYIWKRKRYSDLCDAIGRYVLAGMKPLPEWVEEGQRLLKEIESSEVRFSLSEPIGVCTGDPVGPKGPPGVCPRCGGTDITWEPSSDVSRCNTCGWSDGRGEHGIP